MPDNDEWVKDHLIETESKVMILEGQVSRLSSSMRMIITAFQMVGETLATMQTREDDLNRMVENLSLHPCTEPGCDSIVNYDDEPKCYQHSPDSGSSVPGYSYEAEQAEFEKHADQALAVVADDTGSIDRIH